MNEFDLIAKYFSPLSGEVKSSMGLKDDAAIVPYDYGHDIVVTKDALVENVHFFKEDSAFSVAQKLMRVNISDLAAMGAEPVAFFLALILPKDKNEKWIAEFADGIKNDLQQFGGSLMGGDTVSHDGPLTLTLTAIGKVKHGQAMLRSGAKDGDDIYVTSTIGDSHIGLKILRRDLMVDKYDHSHVTNRYYVPQPRLDVGRVLFGIANSAIDISDGLMADLGHICECSNVGAHVFAGDVPLSDSACRLLKENKITITELVTGGDDYELLFTAPPENSQKISSIAKDLNIRITKIGRIVKGDRAILLDENNREIAIKKSGYSHF